MSKARFSKRDLMDQRADSATCVTVDENQPLYDRRKSVDSLLYSVVTDTDSNRFVIGGPSAAAAPLSTVTMDHLANERTYLGWICFSVGLIGVSISLLKGGGERTSIVEGYLAALISLVALLASTHRYFRVMQMIEDGIFEPNVYSLLFLVVVIVASAGISFSFYFLERNQIW